MNKELRDKLKKIVILRYLLHFPYDVFLTVKAQNNLRRMKQFGVKCEADLEVFKNRYEGERCFVIGLGPSLQAEDLDLLTDEYCFASNRIFFMFPQTKWRPTFYCTGDPRFPRHVGANIREPIRESKYCFLGLAHVDKYDPSIIKEDNVYFYKTITGTGFRSIWRETHEYKGKNIDLTKKLDSVGTITYEMIEMALYMGFKEIYLLGVDNSYNGKSNYTSAVKAYSEKERSLIEAKLNTDAWTRGYSSMKKIAERRGCTIKNAGRGGSLEIFERITLEEVLGQEV